MAQLIADRFLELHPDVTIDCATTERVDLVIDRAGARPDQQSWAEACAKSLADARSRLVDFGFIGCDRRFTASLRKSRAPFHHSDTIRHAIEWLEHTNPASSGIFQITYEALSGALPRELRVRGFIPVNLAMFDDLDTLAALSGALSGRSVVVLQDEPRSARLALGFLRLLAVKTRGSWAIVGAPRFGTLASRADRGTHAAEGRAVFGDDAHRQRFTLRAGSSMIDARAVGMLDDARHVMARGRHAAAERSLRASLAAFERRNDTLHAGDAAFLLGQLLQHRGRAADAYELFTRAREHYNKRGAAAEAVRACAFAGLAQTDRAMFHEAEDILRAAYSAASALPDTNLRLTAGVALARCLLWQSRFGDASQLLEKLTPQDNDTGAARYWCVVARLRVTASDLPGAWSAVARARQTIGGSADPACESTVRTGEAMVQAVLGDVDALECHVREGLRASARAHLPLQAVRLRLTLLEGLLLAKRAGRARDIGARLKTLSKVVLPPLLAKRLARALERLAAPSAHETAPVFYSTAKPASNQEDVDGLTELLSHCHGVEDEREALARAALTIRKQTGALGVGIFGESGTGAAPLAVAGTAGHVVAQRCITLGQPIGVERIAGGFEAATPVRYLGRVIGSIACRWSIDGPASSDRTVAFCSAAAAACAPLVYTLRERHVTPPVSSKSSVELVGVSAAIEDVRRAVARAASAPFTVLIEGESGSGKELVARAIHQTGCRRERRFCPLNCAALPEDLVDTELFGHAKGAFTGAAVERVGLFESADQGTVFLDEVGELSPRAQAKLLRVLQEGEIRRIGETFTRSIDARLIAATNRSLRAEVDAGRFRQDLLYRLDVIRITVPPLRERVEDIPLLAARFWRQTADRIGSKAVLGPGALSALARYDWPGNVRELQNVLTGMVVAVPARGVIGASHMPAAIAHATKAVALETLDMARLRFEQRFVRAALAKTAGHRGQTAAALGLSRQGLAKLMQRLGIDA
jgi:two-component system response regulator HydG